MIEEARRLLIERDLPPPYILVGHSLGGLYANLFARLYPTDVAAVALAESAHPEEIEQQELFKLPVLLKLLNEGVKSIERLFDRYKFSEDECVAQTIAELEKAGHFPNVPLIVLTGTKKMPVVPTKAFEAHLHYQRELLKLSPQSLQVLCDNSGHFPQITEPQRVANAVLQVAAAG